MIAKDKTRVNITINKEALETYKDAAAEWGLTLSEYFSALADADLTIGITAQARCMVSNRREERRKCDERS